jgi:hypothetical protein
VLRWKRHTKVLLPLLRHHTVDHLFLLVAFKFSFLSRFQLPEDNIRVLPSSLAFVSQYILSISLLPSTRR